jgi:hypothetical protein
MGKWEWYGRAGHFICAGRCQMHLHTHVNGYCVSTVGELRAKPDDEEFTPIGHNRLYETMVFKEDESASVSDWSEIDFEGYNDLREAEAGHIKMCEKWARR